MEELRRPIPVVRPPLRVTYSLPRGESAEAQRFRQALVWGAILIGLLCLGGCSAPSPRFERHCDEEHGVCCWSRGPALSCVRVEPMPWPSLGTVPIREIDSQARAVKVARATP